VVGTQISPPPRAEPAGGVTNGQGTVVLPVPADHRRHRRGQHRAVAAVSGKHWHQLAAGLDRALLSATKPGRAAAGSLSCLLLLWGHLPQLDRMSRLGGGDLGD